MGGEKLETVKTNPYLGVEINENLSWSPHINKTTGRAQRLLGFLRRNLRRCPAHIKEKAYFSLVRPVVEYCSPVWSPHQAGLKKKVEMVQRKAARLVCNQPYRRDQRDSVTSMIATLGWESLESRRIKTDLTMMYKVTHQLVAIPLAYLPQLAYSRTRHNHAFKYRQLQGNSAVFLQSAIPRTVAVWNSQPGHLINQTTLDGFKSALGPMSF